jgi:hypothetical protein
VWHLYVEQTLQESGVEKINGFVLSSNKLTHKFVGLVTSDLWLDVAASLAALLETSLLCRRSQINTRPLSRKLYIYGCYRNRIWVDS